MVALAQAASGKAQALGFSPKLVSFHYRALMNIETRRQRLFDQIQRNIVVGGGSSRDAYHTISLHACSRAATRRASWTCNTWTSHRTPRVVLRSPTCSTFLTCPRATSCARATSNPRSWKSCSDSLRRAGQRLRVRRAPKAIDYDKAFPRRLVFDNCILKCYLLVDLKLGKLTHQDVGQMDSYLRLFDGQCTTEVTCPTSACRRAPTKRWPILRCSTMSKQLFSAKYVTDPPSVEELQREFSANESLSRRASRPNLVDLAERIQAREAASDDQSGPAADSAQESLTSGETNDGARPGKTLNGVVSRKVVAENGQRFLKRN